MSIELNYGILCFFKHSNYIMNQIAHSFYNNQCTLAKMKNLISACSGSKNYFKLILSGSKTWIPTPIYSISSRIKDNLLI